MTRGTNVAFGLFAILGPAYVLYDIGFKAEWLLNIMNWPWYGYAINIPAFYFIIMGLYLIIGKDFEKIDTTFNKLFPVTTLTGVFITIGYLYIVTQWIY